MNEREQFQAQVKLVLKPALVADGFRVSGTSFRRVLGEVIHVINLQGSRHDGQCCVCLGIHLTFLPVVGASGGDWVKITEPGCEFRSRHAPPGQSDHWWSYGMTEREAKKSVTSILDMYREVGGPYFNGFSKFPEDFVRVTPSMLMSDASLPFPQGYSTNVRRALALSRIALHLGHIETAKQFAQIGLEKFGLARGLKNEFEKILAMK